MSDGSNVVFAAERFAARREEAEAQNEMNRAAEIAAQVREMFGLER